MARSRSVAGALVMASRLGLALVGMGAPGPTGAPPAPTTWTIQPSPNQSGAVASSLAAVSCRPDGSCMAVGTYFKGPNSDQFTLAERRTGATWTIEPTPPVAGVDYSLLSGVSCA